MTKLATWDSLKRFRANGKAPSLPVILTNGSQRLPQRLEGIGFMMLPVSSGEPFPIELLRDLDVICFLDNCEQAGKIFAFAKRKGISFSRFQSWCGCFGELTSVAMSCQSAAAANAWLESGTL